ncbi:MAG: hypothetical protein OHK006_15270 [Thermodesulfovibrionales bacterium]
MTIALFDFENYSANENAVADVMPVIREQLVRRGYRVIEDDTLNRYLIKERVRSTAHISTQLCRKMKNDLGVGAVMLGSIYTFNDAFPGAFGLSSRLVDTQSSNIIWADFVSASGEDFVKILGLGMPQNPAELVARVTDRLFASFERGGTEKDMEATYRVAVMPFQNKSGQQDVGMVAASLFLVALARHPQFMPVEYGDVREAIVRSRIMSKGQLDYRNIRQINEQLRVDGILVGTVDIYNDGVSTNSPPRATISARLLDAPKQRVLWLNSGQLGGDDRVVILDRGKIRTLDNVAYTLIETLTNDMGRTAWKQ